MSGSRKNRPLRPFTWLLLLGAVAFAAGCSTANLPAGADRARTTSCRPASSVPGWLVVPSGGSHAATATRNYIAGGGTSSCARVPRRGSPGRDLPGLLLREPGRVPPRPGRRTGSPHSRGPEPRGVRQEGPGKLRVRLLPDLPREDLLRRRGADAVLLLPRGERAARPRALARLHVHAHQHGPLERAGLRAVPLPGILEQSGEPSGHARGGGDGPRMLQQHAVPRRCRRGAAPGGRRLGGDASGGPAPRERREGDPGLDGRVRLLPGLPRDRDDVSGELRRRRVRRLLLPLPRG